MQDSTDTNGMTFDEIAAKYGEEAAIQAGIAADPDTWELTDEEFAQMRPASQVDSDLAEQPQPAQEPSIPTGEASASNSHDLYDFMRQISSEMASEYERIRKRSAEDPGTAGDQGEENWASLLRGWLPSTFSVVTKGRIIGSDGKTSPQVDVIVLKDVYPRKLLDKKLYLAGGVAAVFECKTTLRASHIEEATQTCVKIKELFPKRTGSPYEELHAPIVYGVLAHSHSWTAPGSNPEINVQRNLIASDFKYSAHPRQSLDLLCVADLGTWSLTKLTFLNPNVVGIPSLVPLSGENGSAETSYASFTNSERSQNANFTPVGSLIANLSKKLAWESPSLRQLADYYIKADMMGSGSGNRRPWTSSIYSEEIRSRVERQHLSNGTRVG